MLTHPRSGSQWRASPPEANQNFLLQEEVTGTESGIAFRGVYNGSSASYDNAIRVPHETIVAGALTEPKPYFEQEPAPARDVARSSARDFDREDAPGLPPGRSAAPPDGTPTGGAAPPPAATSRPLAPTRCTREPCTTDLSTHPKSWGSS